MRQISVHAQSSQWFRILDFSTKLFMHYTLMLLLSLLISWLAAAPVSHHIPILLLCLKLSSDHIWHFWDIEGTCAEKCPFNSDPRYRILGLQINTKKTSCCLFKLLTEKFVRKHRCNLLYQWHATVGMFLPLYPWLHTQRSWCALEIW